MVTPPLAIRGTVFEDPNYGGGAGRNRAVASGIGRSGVTVELYDGNGNWLSSGLTDSTGAYAFMALTASPVLVRVVEQHRLVEPSRGGCGATRPC